MEQLLALSQMGVGTSLYQISAPGLIDLGESPSQWANASLKTVPLSSNKTSAWDTMLDYIPILKSMGFERIRFSVEWSYIEPSPGCFNEEALNKYLFLVQICLFHGIEPMLTLYHFTHPQWFEKCGAFENEANIPYFVRYCQKVFQVLSPYVHIWCSINEPAVVAFSGYLYGQFPPHKRFKFKLATLVLKNLLKAHVDVCACFEKESQLHAIKIGLVHNVLRFESQSKLIERFITKPLTVFTDDLVMEFLQSGLFNYNGIYYQDLRPKGNCCFLNIYGTVQIGYTGPTCQENQKMGDMYISIYPESYAKALDSASRLNLPIYITEAGIADKLDTLRPEFIIEFLKVVIGKVSEGLDIQALYFWTFKDNYEWNEGHTKQFGLFDIENKPRHSAFLWAWLMNEFKTILSKYTSPKIILARWQKTLRQAETQVKNKNFAYFTKNIHL